ncbi:hypothetical protein [Mycoplasma elephantis]|uniref:hypothetical protein n=1 Tax=Mycoplasma elephantis TaxID=114882 RepID=UPI00047F5300|nr:hypothetical protein [Mycoplasma elephantis]
MFYYIIILLLILVVIGIIVIVFLFIYDNLLRNKWKEINQNTAAEVDGIIGEIESKSNFIMRNFNKKIDDEIQNFILIFNELVKKHNKIVMELNNLFHSSGFKPKQKKNKIKEYEKNKKEFIILRKKFIGVYDEYFKNIEFINQSLYKKRELINSVKKFININKNIFPNKVNEFNNEIKNLVNLIYMVENSNESLNEKQDSITNIAIRMDELIKNINIYYNLEFIVFKELIKDIENVKNKLNIEYKNEHFHFSIQQKLLENSEKRLLKLQRNFKKNNLIDNIDEFKLIQKNINQINESIIRDNYFKTIIPKIDIDKIFSELIENFKIVFDTKDFGEENNNSKYVVNLIVKINNTIDQLKNELELFTCSSLFDKYVELAGDLKEVIVILDEMYKALIFNEDYYNNIFKNNDNESKNITKNELLELGHKIRNRKLYELEMLISRLKEGMKDVQ